MQRKKIINTASESRADQDTNTQEGGPAIGFLGEDIQDKQRLEQLYLKAFFTENMPATATDIPYAAVFEDSATPITDSNLIDAANEMAVLPPLENFPILNINVESNDPALTSPLSSYEIQADNPTLLRKIEILKEALPIRDEDTITEQLSDPEIFNWITQGNVYAVIDVNNALRSPALMEFLFYREQELSSYLNSAKVNSLTDFLKRNQSQPIVGNIINLITNDDLLSRVFIHRRLRMHSDDYLKQLLDNRINWLKHNNPNRSSSFVEQEKNILEQRYLNAFFPEGIPDPFTATNSLPHVDLSLHQQFPFVESSALSTKSHSQIGPGIASSRFISPSFISERPSEHFEIKGKTLEQKINALKVLLRLFDEEIIIQQLKDPEMMSWIIQGDVYNDIKPRDVFRSPALVRLLVDYRKHDLTAYLNSLEADVFVNFIKRKGSQPIILDLINLITNKYLLGIIYCHERLVSSNFDGLKKFIEDQMSHQTQPNTITTCPIRPDKEFTQKKNDLISEFIELVKNGLEFEIISRLQSFFIMSWVRSGKIFDVMIPKDILKSPALMKFLLKERNQQLTKIVNSFNAEDLARFIVKIDGAPPTTDLLNLITNQDLLMKLYLTDELKPHRYNQFKAMIKDRLDLSFGSNNQGVSALSMFSTTIEQIKTNANFTRPFKKARMGDGKS